MTSLGKIKCPFIKCAAGMGVAGNRHCFLGGDYTKDVCDRFQDEEEFLKKWKKREKTPLSGGPGEKKGG